MRIVGIDCGTERTGFGVIDSDGRSHTFVTAGVIRTQPSLRLEFRLKQIASELGTVEKTVKVHRARVMDKMQVDSVAELVRIAEKIGAQPKSN